MFGFDCICIEDGHNEVKVQGETRIPAGTYNLFRRTYGKFYEKYKKRYNHEFVYELNNVPNYTAVLCHIGNTNKDTAGCLLINNSVDLSNNQIRGAKSALAYQEFYNHLAHENNHTLIIVDLDN